MSTICIALETPKKDFEPFKIRNRLKALSNLPTQTPERVFLQLPLGNWVGGATLSATTSIDSSFQSMIFTNQPPRCVISSKLI